MPVDELFATMREWGIPEELVEESRLNCERERQKLMFDYEDVLGNQLRETYGTPQDVVDRLGPAFGYRIGKVYVTETVPLVFTRAKRRVDEFREVLVRSVVPTLLDEVRSTTFFDAKLKDNVDLVFPVEEFFEQKVTELKAGALKDHESKKSLSREKWKERLINVCLAILTALITTLVTAKLTAKPDPIHTTPQNVTTSNGNPR
ncbi:MAG TPA: hypothetical protein VGP72_08555 [Planctomycetota bacterium]|jgi:Mg2+ and Co2+ transporter CorA